MYSYHVHSTFSDGENTPEEIVINAIEKDFVSIGFSDHGFTDYDSRYCMKDQAGYIREIQRLKEQYKDRIQVYLGVEEDAFYPLDRERFDYIIGSCHYALKDGRYYPIDSNLSLFKECVAAFGNDHLAFAESYYSRFCAYINHRKPDIVGHFDLITKYDEAGESLFLHDPAYEKLSEKYIAEAAKSGSIFEVNTGAIARGIRTSVYPLENLLYVLKKNDASLILSSDSHSIKTLDFAFSEMKKYLRDIGFEKLTVLKDGVFKQIPIC